MIMKCVKLIFLKEKKANGEIRHFINENED